MKMTDEQIWKLCEEYGSNARMWARKFVALLPEVSRRDLYKKHGFYSIYEFAAKVGGVSGMVVDKVLNLHKKLQSKPLLREQIAEQGWAKVEIAARIPVKEKEAVGMLKALPKSTLQLYAKESVDIISGSFRRRTGSELQSVTFKLDPKTYFELKKFQRKLERERNEPVPLGIVLKELLKLVPEEVSKKISVECKSAKITRYIPVAIRRGNNNDGKCAFPGCSNPHTNFHHPDRFARAGNHRRLVPLCHEHHRLAHTGLIVNENDLPENWKLRTEMQPDIIDRKYLQYAAGPPG